MLKLIIADDEKMIREGIKTCLTWADYNIEIAGVVRNGLEALELAQQVKPDVVITDVRMPVMDGITLAAKLREIDCEVKIIFVSGFSDVDYLKSAFKHEAADYILKPVDISELELTIKKVVSHYGKEKEKDVYRLQLEQKLLQSMPFLREKFMKLLVCGEIKNRQEIIDKLEFLEIDIPKDSLYTIFVVSIDNFDENTSSISEYDKQLMNFSILNIVQEIINTYTRGYVFEWENGEYICVVSLPKDDLLVEECIDNVSSGIHQNLNNLLKLSNTLGIGRWVDNIEQLNHTLKYARSALGRKLVLGNNRIIYMDRQLDENEGNHRIEGSFFESFSIALQNADKDKVSNLILRMFDEIKVSEITDKKYIRSLCLQLVTIIYNTVNRIKSLSEKDEWDLYYLSGEIFKKETIDEMQQLLLRATYRICEISAVRQEGRNTRLVQEIKRIIECRYGEELSINSIAHEVYLTPAYICMLFKQETGQTINNYLTLVRIENAKALLVKGSCKMFEIATMVGYSDQKYFSKLFKKYTGVNPSDFRQDV